MRTIDADALKDVIQQHDYPLADRLNSVDNGMFTLGIFQAIDQMPTISRDEVRGVGHWVTEQEAIDANDYSLRDTCSVCGRCDWDCTESASFKYCPNCGAKMEVSEDG